MKAGLLAIGLAFCLLLKSQNEPILSLSIVPLQNNKTLSLTNINTNDISISSLKFYLTQFRLSKNGKTTWKEDKSYHLIDLAQPNSLNILLDLNKDIEYDAVHFLFGTDSLTNVAGVLGGDLDPTKGMYWAWNSGYINFKLEGKAKDIPFEFHLGGYMPPYTTVQEVQLNTSQKERLNIYLDLQPFLSSLNLSKPYKIMSPGLEAQTLVKKLSTLFYLNEKK